MSKYEIHKGDPTQIDSVGFKKRLEGKEVRDCLLVLEDDGKCLSGLLVRGEMGSTVHEEVIRNGQGVLDIDRCRIRTEEVLTRDCKGWASSKNEGYRRPWMQNSKKENFGSTEGRFPANLILKHGEGCKCVGTKLKEIKGSGKVTGGSGYQLGGYDHGQKDKRPSFEGYAKDGKEEVADWECEEGCPIRELDQQSVAGGIHGAGGSRQKVVDSQYAASSYNMSGSRQMNRYGDSGGASRFFKQVQSEEDLDAYLNTLIRG